MTLIVFEVSVNFTTLASYVKPISGFPGKIDKVKIFTSESVDLFEEERVVRSRKVLALCF